MTHAEGEKDERESTGEPGSSETQANQAQANQAQEKEPEKGWRQVELTPYSPLLARLKTLRQAVRQVQDATRAQLQQKEASQKEDVGEDENSGNGGNA